MSPAGELDDPFIARYAERVDDEVEVLWRADFARMVDMRERAFDEDVSLFPTADEIEAYWMSDPQVDPRWCELREIHSAWVYAPEAMRRAHEVTMPGGLRPPGMDQPRWASHMQAREMTGHGYWPGHEPTQSLSSPERHEPMTDTTDRFDPADPFGVDEMFRTESDTEQLMRSDFVHWAAVGHGRDPGDYDPADDVDRNEYASTWLNHAEDRWASEWLTLTEAHLQYQDNLFEADTKRAMLGDVLGPVEARSWDQARDMAVNGIARDEYGLPASSYVTRLSYERADEIRSQQRSLADARREQGELDWSGEEPSLTDESLNPSLGQQMSIDAVRYDSATQPLSFRASVQARTRSLNERAAVPVFSGVAAQSGNALADALELQDEREHEGAER